MRQLQERERVLRQTSSGMVVELSDIQAAFVTGEAEVEDKTDESGKDESAADIRQEPEETQGSHILQVNNKGESLRV